MFDAVAFIITHALNEKKKGCASSVCWYSFISLIYFHYESLYNDFALF